VTIQAIRKNRRAERRVVLHLRGLTGNWLDGSRGSGCIARARNYKIYLRKSLENGSGASWRGGWQKTCTAKPVQTPTWVLLGTPESAMRRTAVALLVVVCIAVLPASALAVSITNVVFDPPSPANLDFGEIVDFTFDYQVDEESRIFGRPLTGGAPSFAWAGHPSPAYTGSGSGTGFFTIQDVGQGIAHVDQVRFRVVATDDDALLYETFVDVDYTLGSAVIPEPASVVLLLTGLAVLTGYRRRSGR